MTDTKETSDLQKLLSEATSGPWAICLDGEFNSAQCLCSDGFYIATLWGGYDAAAADAQLMLAAPDLAAALIHEREAHAETQAALRAFIADLDRANAALILAKEALRTLAVMADRYDPDDGDGDLECWSGLAVPKILHIRAARTALDAINKLGVK